MQVPAVGSWPPSGGWQPIVTQMPPPSMGQWPSMPFYTTPAAAPSLSAAPLPSAAPSTSAMMPMFTTSPSFQPQLLSFPTPASLPAGHIASQGNRRALLIGINYTGQRGQLRGCHNDVQLMAGLLQAAGWQPQEMMIVTDKPDNPHQPTYNGILTAFHWLSEGTQPGDIRFLHFSGHGGILPPAPGSNKPPDSYDQTIFPVDHMQGKRQIRDGVIYSYIVAPLPAGSRITIIMDCCHSGAIVDMPYQYVAHQFESTKYFDNGRRIPGTPSPFWTNLDKRRPISSGLRLLPELLAGRMESRLDGPGYGGPEGWRSTGAPVPAADVLMISSCKSWQLSADVQHKRPTYDIPDDGVSGGALTAPLVSLVKKAQQSGRQISLWELLEGLREIMKKAGLFQVPQLSSSAILDLNRPFSLNGPLTPTQQPHHQTSYAAPMSSQSVVQAPSASAAPQPYFWQSSAAYQQPMVFPVMMYAPSQ